MKKKIWALCLAAVALLTFNACSDDDDDNVTPEYLEGAVAYTAGAGNYKANDGTVGAIMQSTTGTFGYSDIYTSANSRGVGDAQDVLPMGGKIYVACTTSSKVELLNNDGMVEKSLSMPNKSPRYLATDGSYVYASAYSGYVYKFSKDLTLVDSVQVGSHPEALSVANGKLFVNMSDYNYDNTGKSVAVVNLRSFTKTKDIECALNPYNQSVANGNNIYIVSVYHSTQPGLVQRIDATTDQLTSMNINAGSIAYNPKTNSIIGLNTYYDSNYTSQFDGFFAYNLSTGTTTSFDASALKSPQQVNVDPSTGNIYVIDNPSYNTPSVLYIYDQNGNLLQGGITMGYSVQNIRFPYEAYK